MAFAVLQAVSSGNLTANTVTFSLSVNGTVNSGDILLAVLASDGNPTITWDQSAAGTWTALWDTVNGTAVKSVAYWKLADGTEANKQLKVISGAAEAYAYHISRWSGAHTTAPFEKTVSFSLTASLSVPALQVTTASADYQFVAICVYDGNNTVSTYPTNYINTSNSRAAAVGGAGIGWATRSISGSSVAQARFVLSGADDAILHHVSIRPAPPIVDQTLDAGLVASGLTFYTQSLTMRLRITTPLLASGLTHYAPSFTLGDRTLNVGLVASGLTLYSPTIQTTAQSINVGLVASGLTHYAPSFSMRREVSLGLVASGLSFFTQSLAMRKEVNVGLFDSTVTHYAPSIAGSLDVNLGLATFEPTFYAMTLNSPAIVTVKLRAVTLELVGLDTVTLTDLNY